MTTREQHAMVVDLAKHLDQRIDQALDDFYQRAVTIVGADPDTARGVALTALGRQLVALAHSVDATEPEFVTMCRWHFHQARQTL